MLVPSTHSQSSNQQMHQGKKLPIKCTYHESYSYQENFDSVFFKQDVSFALQSVFVLEKSLLKQRMTLSLCN